MWDVARFGDVTERDKGGEFVLSIARSLIDRLLAVFVKCLRLLVLVLGVPEDERLGLIIDRYNDVGDFMPAPPTRSGEAINWRDLLDILLEDTGAADVDRFGSVFDRTKVNGASATSSHVDSSTLIDDFDFVDAEEQDTKSGAVTEDRVEGTGEFIL